MRSEWDTADDDAMDTRVIAALERRPRVEIPAGFAARVAASAERRPQAATPRYGPLTLYAALVVLVGAMVVVARFGAPGATLALECVLVAEMVGLAVCLGLAPGMLR